MKKVSAADANRHFSRILREVAAGETVEVTSYGRTVARISPVSDDAELTRKAEAKRRLMARLNAQAAQNLGPWTRDDAYGDESS